MHYLTLSADFGRVSVLSEAAGSLVPEDLGLPDRLLDELRAWNDRYQQVIGAGLETRRLEPLLSLIEDLDRQGLALADQLAATIGAGSKVAYYSEGQLRLLPL